MQMAPNENNSPAPNHGLEALFEANHGRVLATALRVTGSRADAEDVLQTVFLRLARRPEPPPGPPEASAAYLRRAAINASIDLLRSRERAGAIPLDETPGELADTEAISPERAQQDREFRRQLRRALASLPKGNARVFVLRYFEGMSHREIGAALDLTRTAAAVALFRARRRLQKQLTQYQRGES